MHKSRMKDIIKAGGAFLACLLLFMLFFFFLNNYYVDQRRERARNAGDAAASSLTGYLYQGLYCTGVTDILCRDTDPDYEEIALIVDDFINVSDDILKIVMIYDSDRSLRFLFPEEKEEDYFGGLLKEGGALYREAEYAEKTGKRVISNSFRLLSGHNVFALVQPVIKGGIKGSGTKNFIVALLDTDMIMEKSGVKSLKDQGYNYRVYKPDPATGETETLSEFGSNHMKDAVMIDKETFPGDWWHIIISLNGGWISDAERATALFASFFISFLIAFALFLVLSLKSREEELKVMSYSDSLTKIKNTRAYTEALEGLNDSQERYGVIYIDVNDFKGINDTYGHNTGDDILMIIAERIGNIIRKTDELFRIGGDEFAVIIHGGYDETFYREIMDRMKSVMNRKVVIRQHSLNVTVSCGFARYPEDGVDYRSVIMAADKEMYKDKAENHLHASR